MVVSDQRPSPNNPPAVQPYSPMRTVLAVLLAATPPGETHPRRYQGRSPITAWRTLTEQHLPPYLPTRILPPWMPDKTSLPGDASSVTRSALRWTAAFFATSLCGILLLVIGESLGLAMEPIRHGLLLGMGGCLGAASVQIRRVLPRQVETPGAGTAGDRAAAAPSARRDLPR